MSKKSFWDKCSGLYEMFMKKDSAVYDKLYDSIAPNVKNKYVLELATGTGMIARNIAKYTKGVEATDFSYEMIDKALKIPHPNKVRYSVADICRLPYRSKSFEVIIVSNALHIIQEPELAIKEIKRVLSDDGILIAPNFVHGKMKYRSILLQKIMIILGFPLENKWTYNQYKDFLEGNGFTVVRGKVFKASFPLAYVECKKS